jgi:formyl-CoA transferase
MEGMLPEYAVDGRIRQPVGAAIPTAAPTNTYPCADGKWLCIAGNSDLIFGRLMHAIGRLDLASDPAYASNPDRCARRDTLDAAIAAWTRTLPARTAQELLEAADVPCSRLYDISDCATDPHFLARKSVQSVNDPLIGNTLHPGPAIRLNGDPPEAAIGWPGPSPARTPNTCCTSYSVCHEAQRMSLLPSAETPLASSVRAVHVTRIGVSADRTRSPGMERVYG